ncbi:unnamed protein product, partial [marine sediment metagenome]
GRTRSEESPLTDIPRQDLFLRSPITDDSKSRNFVQNSERATHRSGQFNGFDEG